jgi:hypothetical protein
MTMDDLIFEMNQPNELVTHSEWTEWWVVDEKGLRLEYADGWSAEQEYGLNEQSETFVSEEEHISYIDKCYDEKLLHLQERYEECYGKLDENYANNLYTEYDIDVLAENTQVTIESAIDIEEWPSDYLEYLRDIIDEYNSADAPWLKELGKLRAETLPEDSEEKIIDLPNTDGLILPS